MADFLIPMEAGFWLAFATAAITVALIVVLLVWLERVRTGPRPPRDVNWARDPTAVAVRGPDAVVQELGSRGSFCAKHPSVAARRASQRISLVGATAEFCSRSRQAVVRWSCLG